MMPTLSSLAAQQVVVMTTLGFQGGGGGGGGYLEANTVRHMKYAHSLGLFC